MNVTRFDSTKLNLRDVLNDVGEGKIQLPDFQRGWVWDDDHIRDLITSVSLSFPIGAIMTLKTGGPDVSFKPRPIEGTRRPIPQVEPDTLVLDGQQRLTSLFQSLKSGNAVATRDTRGREISRWYYLDMKKCVSDDFDREDAVISLPEDRIAKTFRGETIYNLSMPENEYAEDMFPLHKVFDPAEWRRGYSEHWCYDPEKWQLWDKFEAQIIRNFEQYQIPVITLDSATSKEAVCIVFEKVNTGGVTLTVFELLTASFAADNFQLRDDWTAREERLTDAHPVLHSIESPLFLQALTLLATRVRGSAVSCRRRDILRLEIGEYEAWADKVEDAFKKAARFLHGQKVFNSRDLPYQTQIVPLAAILADLGDEANTEGAHKKIARWYWCGVLGEMYGGTIETRFAADLTEVTDWVRGNPNLPRTIQDANFQANRLHTLRSRNSAAYKGIHALLMRDGSRDFRTGEPIEDQIFFDDNIDIHHIFPQNWCNSHGIDKDRRDSIINKTAISARTNRSIGGHAPSEYLALIQRDAGIDIARMDEILCSHRIPANALRTDDFEQFFAMRAEALTRSIEVAIEKNVTREEGLF